MASGVSGGTVVVTEAKPDPVREWIEGLREEHRLLYRSLWLLEGLAGSPVPSKWFDEFQALSADLAEYLEPDDPNDNDDEGKTYGKV